MTSKSSDTTYGFPPRSDYFAALDLGSNTCRLLVARQEGTEFRVVDSFSRIIRLGTGLHLTGFLSDDAMDRAIIALKECARKIQKYKITDLRCVATEACRQADNAKEFLDRISFETGLNIEVICEAEEARLALEGCKALIDYNIPYVLAFDIGGCSTEAMWAKVMPGKTVEVCDLVSVPYGVVSVIDASGGDPQLFYDDIRSKIANSVRSLSDINDIQDKIDNEQVQLIGSSGTTTTIAAIHLALPYYDRSQVDGCEVPLEIVREIGDNLRNLSHLERSNHSCIGPGRSDLVVGGMAILEGICDAWPIPILKVADRGVRDGIISDILSKRISDCENSISVA